MGSNKRLHRQSLSEAISVSLGLQSQPVGESGFPSFSRANAFAHSLTNSPRLGRSYLGALSPPVMKERNSSNDFPASFKPDQNQSIHKSQNLHRQTAALSNDFDGAFEFDDQADLLQDRNESNKANEESAAVLAGLSPTNSESETPYPNESLDVTDLLLSSHPNQDLEYGAVDRSDEQYISLQSPRDSDFQDVLLDPNASTMDKVTFTSRRVVMYIPSVILGLLLNILDALSYGLIIFPITEPFFAHMGPAGLSMFYVSCIISQVTYSSGFSAFRNAVGSEMIEITPFYHAMAASISTSLSDQQDRAIPTTIVCYALSSVMTGLLFFLLGKMRLGKIVGFFPRHILIGCIGGVGYFLIITGLEVTTRVSKFEYSFGFLSSLFTDFATFGKWALPTVMAVSLVVIQHVFENSLVLPTFYIAALVIFHFVVALVPSLSLDSLRGSGWIFPPTDSTEHWYGFYQYYNFRLVSWPLILKQIPTMLALTFFGILHVPINVPALAMSVGVDKYDVDKELIAHGYSNFLSGLVGSVQNYLVYTNSVLFIRAGADSAMAGMMLAAATFGIMTMGPVIISYIPICIVGSLIFLLGYELMKEALYDTWGKLNKFEYATIVIIVFTMGAFDFVLGIIVGILIACFSFLVDSAKLQTVNGEFNGQVARSTVRRDYIQTQFLNKIGEQIHILKLQNILFFGTILSIEEKIDKLLEISNNDASKQRIKYLILDFKNINADNIDYSAAEGFNRIKRFTSTKRINLIISSIKTTDVIYNAFNKVGLLDGVELFGDLNSALEWCENELLVQFKELRARPQLHTEKKRERTMNKGLLPLNTPRNTQFVSVAQKLLTDEQSIPHYKQSYREKQPVLPLLFSSLQKFRPQMMSSNNKVKETEEKLWAGLGKYFVKRRLAAQTLLPHRDNIFFVIESGMVKVTYNLRQGQLYEIMSGKTCYGRMSTQGSGDDLISCVEVTMETDCTLWIIDEGSLAKLKNENPNLYTEILLVTLSINQERLRELLGYCLVSS
ncbi:LANO_0H21066g1_1 [Lachancea nothofagi CBS 11611]|uniref:LANO_0H21066g1_1 n=1 Tax=Lachancea nothofagi CBS 11611 TaxID=1266666 RepID=A0A1G4KNF7_9SACH|nr:LANO_0H21066g1_1 [Lachancea nothofagi CBS 11611]